MQQQILSSPYNCFPKLIHLLLPFLFLFLFLEIKLHDLRQTVWG